jgi:methionyl-tRNA formyltransferase
MNILFLGPTDSSVYAVLATAGLKVALRSAHITAKDCQGFDRLVSHGYRYYLHDDVLSLFGRNAINCHISLLPHNRGAYPNVWAWLEGTPHGVTIHQMDSGIDTGPIITQKEVTMNAEVETLTTSYNRLQHEMGLLFKEFLPKLLSGEFSSVPQQEGKGRWHDAGDLAGIQYLLTNGWHTPCSVLNEYAVETCCAAEARDRICEEIERGV